MSKQAEQQTEWVINNILVNNDWVIDNTPKKNVFFQKAKPEHQSKLEIFSKKKGYKKPDYILYKEDTPIGIIEAKRGGEPLKEALKRATEYAEMLEAPLIFASNGAYVETNHLIKQNPLFINGEKVDKIIRYKEAVEFFEKKDNEIYTIPKELIKSKEDLIKIFKSVNNLLRKANVFSGYDRISEFSSILFLKLISEQEGEKSYWNSIKKQDDEFLFSYLNGTVIKQLENKYGGGVFSEINIKKPSLLRQIIEMIDPLILSDIKTDIKGDAFEYFLKNMNQADNDLGQYFTPRHIVKAMVHLVNPKFKETIYDPFCGTGGFLTESFNHIKENSIIETEEEKKILKENTLFGRDATKVSTIAKKNMILHGDGHSNIKEEDSLENPVINEHKCIITNIPFSLKDVDYSHLYYNGLGKKNGDAVCVLHCLQALVEGGRMALIVPEGFLFKKELKEVRKFLLSRANLELVISLPQGVFQPYTGVKTDILYLTNAHKPEAGKEGYYYFEVKNDGFSLDAHRRKLEGANDIYKLESNNIKKSEREILKQQGFEFIPFSKIEANDYNLVGTRYREIKRQSGKRQMVKLGEVLELTRGVTYKKDDEVLKETQNIILRANNISIENGLYLQDLVFLNENINLQNEKLLKENDIFICLASGSKNHLGKVAFIDCENANKYYAGGFMGILRTKEGVSSRYLFYTLNNLHWKEYIINNVNGTNINNLRFNLISNFEIPLPPLEEQIKIVEKLDVIQKSIKEAQNLISSLKQGGGTFFQTFGNEDCDVVKLGTVCKYEGGTQPPKETFIDTEKEGYIRLLQIRDYKSDERAVYIPKSERHKTCNEEDVMIGRYGPPVFQILKGKKGAYNVALIKTIPNEERLLKNYLYYFLNSSPIQEHIISLSIRARQSGVLPSDLDELQIPLPPLSVQEEIVEEMDAELNFIKQTETIIEKQKSKMNLILQSLWKA